MQLLSLLSDEFANLILVSYLLLALGIFDPLCRSLTHNHIEGLDKHFALLIQISD